MAGQPRSRRAAVRRAGKKAAKTRRLPKKSAAGNPVAKRAVLKKAAGQRSHGHGDVSIIAPGDGDVVLVSTTGTIDSHGTAEDGNGNYASVAYAKIYSDPADAPIKPPPSATPGMATTTPSGANWNFASIEGAASSPSEPYPTNYLAADPTS